MIVHKYNGYAHSPVEWVKANLKFIGNISSFEVYQKEEDAPSIYRNTPDFYVYEGIRHDSNHSYQFIMRDDDAGVETWLGGCNCGYSGGGPNATKEILQIVGIKIDYDIIAKKNMVKMKNLTTHHDLNIVVFKPLDKLHFQKEELVHVFLRFKSAHEKWEAKRALEVIGNVQPLRDSSPIIEELYHANLSYSTEKEWYDYSKNIGVVLPRALSDINDKFLAGIIEHIAYKYNAYFKITKL